MARSIQMKALVAAVTNLSDGSILVTDPNHISDNRARYPRVYSKVDADRLEADGVAERHTGAIEPLDTKEAKDRQRRINERAKLIDKAREREESDELEEKLPTGRRGATKAAPGVETDKEAARTADEIEGDAAPAGGGRRRG